MVNPLSAAMQEEWMLPSFLLCGGFANNFALSYIWYIYSVSGRNYTVVEGVGGTRHKQRVL